MAPNLSPSVFKIDPLIEGNLPASVNLTKPGSQYVYINGPLRPVWQLFVHPE